MFSVVDGPNFSGRTKLLRDQTHFGDSAPSKPVGKRYAYFDLSVPDYLTGIASTVSQELHITTVEWAAPIVSLSKELERVLDFKRLESRNPFVLSGGEQSVLAVLSALRLSPKRIAIDCALEQLAPAWRLPVFETVEKAAGLIEGIWLADNRLHSHLRSEVGDNTKKISLLASEKTNRKQILSKLPPIKITPTSVALSDISFSYGRKLDCVISRLNYEFKPGGIYLLKGNNGAGKSTLSKLLAGLLNLQSGTVLASDKKINPAANPANIFAYHFQNPDYQLFSLTVEKEIRSALRGGTGQVSMWLATFGLGNDASLHPLELPYVQRKRLALAATFAMQRPWMILDEPSLGQDQDALSSICDLCRAYAEAGGGVIVIGHSHELQELLNPVVIILREGRLW